MSPLSFTHHSAPQFFSPLSTPRIFRQLIICVLFPLGWGLILFGIPAVITLCLALATAGVLYFLGVLLKLPDIWEFVCFPTLLIVALMPPNVSPAVVITAVAFSLIVAKWAFRTPESMWVNPVTVSLAFCYVIFPEKAFQGWELPFFLKNTVLVVHPLQEMMQEGIIDWMYTSAPVHEWSQHISEYMSGLGSDVNVPVRIVDGFIGWTPGAIGTGSALILLIVSVVLLVRRIIPGKLVLSYFLSFSVAIYVLGGLVEGTGFFTGYVLTHLVFGNVLFGMFFLLLDSISRPMDHSGMIVYGMLAGLFTAVFRLWGKNDDGVVEALLLANICVPVMNKIHIWSLQKRRNKEVNTA